MLHSFAPVFVLTLLGGQPAAPEIVNPHATYGFLGAPRPKGQGMLPGDVAHFSFGIKNLKPDANGKVAYSIAIVIHDAQGKLLFEQKPYKAVAQRFGGDTAAAAARIEVPLDSKPGPVQWKVTVMDRTTDKSTEMQGKGKILPADFGLVQVGTFADPEDHVPTPPIGVVGGNLFLSFGVTGFMRGGKDKQPDIKVSLRILDAKGQATLAQPLTGRVTQDIAPGVRVVPLQFALSLDRVGHYTLELSAEDALSGKSASVSFPVRILSAE